MKVLLLDIDGVVNNAHTWQRYGGFIGIDPEMAALVKDIVARVKGLKVVLSSTWRLNRKSLEEVKRVVGKIDDVTPDLGSSRGLEINAWLSEHPEVERYAILDDDSDMLPDQMPNFFKTTWQEGITREIADRVINHYNYD